MHLLDALDCLDGRDFVFTRAYQILRIVSPSGDVLPDDCKAAISDEKPVLLEVMRAGVDYSPALLLDLCECYLERLAIQSES